MKKLMIALVAIFITATTSAQGVDLGIKLGANFSTLSDVVGVKNKTGIHAGIFGAVKFGGIAVQAEMLYSQQGTDKFDLDYINVPLFIKYYMVQGLNLQFGPQFGFLVKDGLSNAEINKSDVSGLIGLGYDFPFGLRLESRYNLGFTDVPKGAGEKGKNNVFSLALGYSFL